MYLGQMSTGKRAVGGGSTERMTDRRRAPACPGGAIRKGSGSYGTGTSKTFWTDCYFPPAPRAAPRAAAAAPSIHFAPVTRISPAIQTQISPQISPTMAQQQASPGAAVAAAPQQVMPGGMRAATGAPAPLPPGVRDWRIPSPEEKRAVEAEKRAKAAEQKLQEQREAQQFATMQRQIQERYRVEQEIRAAEQRSQQEAQRAAEAERAQAEAKARQAAVSVPVPRSMAPAAAPQPPFAPVPLPTPQPPKEDIRQQIPLFLILAVGGVAAVALVAGKRKQPRKRK